MDVNKTGCEAVDWPHLAHGRDGSREHGDKPSNSVESRSRLYMSDYQLHRKYSSTCSYFIRAFPSRFLPLPYTTLKNIHRPTLLLSQMQPV
jgi:hypothetical protein